MAWPDRRVRTLASRKTIWDEHEVKLNYDSLDRSNAKPTALPLNLEREYEVGE